MKSGFLYKQREWRKSWRRRYFQLEDSVLTYYLSEGDVQPRGLMLLRGVSVTAIDGVKFQGGAELHRFVLFHERTGQRFSLATSRAERNDWISALRAAAESDGASSEASAGPTLSPLPSRRGQLESCDAFGVPRAHAPQVELMVRRVLDAVKDSCWRFHLESRGVRCFMGDFGEAAAALGQGMVPYPPRAVLALYTNLSLRPEIDVTLGQASVIDDLGPQTSVQHHVYKPVWPTSVRDICCLVHWRVLEDGRIVVASSSVYDSRCTKPRGSVRVRLLLGGLVIEPSADGRTSQLTSLCHWDLELPHLVVAKITAAQTMVIEGIAQTLRAEPDQAALLYPLAPVTNLAPLTSPSRQLSTKRRSSVTPAGRVREAPPMLPVRERGVAPHHCLVLLLVPAMAWVAPTHYCHVAVYVAAALMFCIRFLVARLLGAPGGSLARQAEIAAWGYQCGCGGPHIVCRAELNTSAAEAWLEGESAASGVRLTLTHLCVKAVGLALARTPSVNGHITLGQFYPSSHADVACVSGGNNGASAASQWVKVQSAESKTVVEIARAVQTRAANNAVFDGSAYAPRWPFLLLPPWLAFPVFHLLSLLAACVGANFPSLGLHAWPCGTAIVTSVLGASTIVSATAPAPPTARVPVSVTLGSVRRIEGEGTVMSLTTTLDSRYGNASVAAELTDAIVANIMAP